MGKIDWSILKRSITGDLSGEERLELERWLEDSGDNKRYYRKMERFFAETSKPDVDTMKNFRKFEQRTYGKRKRAIVSFTKYAAVVVLLAGVVFLFREFGSVEKQPDVSRLAIEPGRERALLYTSSGEVILLENREQRDILTAEGLMVRQDSNVLNYASDTSRDAGREEMHQMRIPCGGEFKMLLSDGTMVYLNSETELSYPVRFHGEERRVVLSGEAYFDVTKSDKPFIVEVNGVEVKVLGTRFNVHAYGDDARFETTLEEGSVEVRAKHETVLLRPGEQAVLEGGDRLAKRVVDVARYVAWKDGQFVFEDERLEDVMNTVARWYDIRVFYRNADVKDVRINGNISRYQDFRILLQKLEKLDIVRFEVNERTITLIGK